MFLGYFNIVIWCHYHKWRALNKIVKLTRDGTLVLENWKQDYTVGPALLQILWVNVYYFSGTSCESWIWCTLGVFKLCWEWPFAWIHWMIVSFPYCVHNFQIYHCSFVENSDTFVGMFGEEKEVTSFWYFCFFERVPYTIFELYNTVFDHQCQGNIELNTHFVLKSDKQLAILCLFVFTELFCYSF